MSTEEEVDNIKNKTQIGGPLPPNYTVATAPPPPQPMPSYPKQQYHVPPPPGTPQRISMPQPYQQYQLYPQTGTPQHILMPPQQQQQQQYQLQPQPGTQLMQAVFLPLGPKSALITCPNCHQTQETNIIHVSSLKTHILALIMLAIAFCCCIPYLFDCCKNVEHYCSKCGAYLGKYER